MSIARELLKSYIFLRAPCVCLFYGVYCFPFFYSFPFFFSLQCFVVTGLPEPEVQLFNLKVLDGFL